MSSFYGHWEGRGVEVTAMIKTGLCSLGIPCADWKQGQAVESGVRSADMGPGRLNGCDVAGGSFMKPEQWIPARAEAWMRTWAVGSETELCVGRCGYISDLSGQEHFADTVCKIELESFPGFNPLGKASSVSSTPRCAGSKAGACAPFARRSIPCSTSGPVRNSCSRERKKGE